MAAFIDTNILLYAYSKVNEGEVRKVAVARRLITELSEQRNLILSAQVLNEFISVAIKKGPQPLQLAEIARIVERLSTQEVVSIDGALVELALRRMENSRISYWDALIVEAAIRSGATTLYTEDMHHGTRYGVLQLVNPFAS